MCDANDDSPLLIAVLGATGAGKSAVAEALANSLNGECISVDSMQLWEGLPIATNQEVKPVVSTPGPTPNFSPRCPACDGAPFVRTDSGLKGVAHHLVGYRNDVEAAEFSIQDFVRDAVCCVSTAGRAQKVPVLVGGTNYYAEALLWTDVLIDDLASGADADRFGAPLPSKKNDMRSDAKGGASTDTPTSDSALVDTKELLTEVAGTDNPSLLAPRLYSQLQLVDPDAARKLHPNDFRRVRRCLEVFRDSGVSRTQLLSQRPSSQDDNTCHCRYKRLLVVWVFCERSVLTKRLDQRVDVMVKRGLVAEVVKFYDEHSDYIARCLHGTGSTLRGPFVAIGFKEFLPYLQSSGNDEHRRDASLLDQCIAVLKQNTKRYARQQEAWMRNKVLPRLQQHHAQSALLQTPVQQWLCSLDSTELGDTWDTGLARVVEVSRKFIQHDIDGLNNATEIESTRFLKDLTIAPPSVEWKKYRCDVCNRELNGTNEWEVHQKCRSHRKRVRSLAKKETRKESQGTASKRHRKSP